MAGCRARRRRAHCRIPVASLEVSRVLRPERGPATARVRDSQVAAPGNPEVLPEAPDKRVTRAVNPVAAHKRLGVAVLPARAVRRDRMSRLECREQACPRSEFRCQKPAALLVAVRANKADRQVQTLPTQVAVPAAVLPTMRAFSPVRAARAVADSRVSQAELLVRKADHRVRAEVGLPAVQAPLAIKPEVRERMPVPARVKAVAKAMAKAMARVAQAVSRTPGELRRDRRANPPVAP
jgi:hypothetical protein